MSDLWRFVASTFAELFALVVVVGAVLVLTARSKSLLRRLAMWSWRGVSRISARPNRSVLVIALLVFLITATTQWIAPRPPELHDEFSNLLLADTLASGRLSNPTHSLYEHFETFHVLQRPSYSSKYPPALGLALAIGQWLLGAAPLGVCLLHAFAGAAVTWMLQAWTRSRWAFVGGVLFAMLPVIQTEWSRSFMGSGAAILGAALVLGACKRLTMRNQWMDAALLSAGLLCLANSRPYEGFVFAVICLSWLVMQLCRSTNLRWPEFVAKCLAPAGLVLAAGGVLMSAHCHAVTGKWLRLPYVEHQTQYAISPSFLWQSISEANSEAAKSHPNDVFRNFYESYERNLYLKQHSLSFLARFKGLSALNSLATLVNPILLASILVMFPWLLTRRLALPWMLLAASLLASLGVVWLQTPYIAPMLPPLLLLSVMGLRRVFLWRRELRQGQSIVFAFVSVQAALLVMAMALLPVTQTSSEWALHREKIQSALARSGKRHLIVVAYSDGHNPHHEWVYNRADIDNAPVVWARHLDADRNQRLFNYFEGREQWVLMADTSPPRLVPVAPESAAETLPVRNPRAAHGVSRRQ